MSTKNCAQHADMIYLYGLYPIWVFLLNIFFVTVMKDDNNGNA